MHNISKTDFVPIVHKEQWLDCSTEIIGEDFYLQYINCDQLNSFTGVSHCPS